MGNVSLKNKKNRIQIEAIKKIAYPVAHVLPTNAQHFTQLQLEHTSTQSSYDNIYLHPCVAAHELIPENGSQHSVKSYNYVRCYAALHLISNIAVDNRKQTLVHVGMPKSNNNSSQCTHTHTHTLFRK